MFALIEGVLLRPLPVQEQDRLLVAWKELRSAGFAHYPFRVAEIDSISKEGHLFESAAGVDYNGAQPWIVVEEGWAIACEAWRRELSRTVADGGWRGAHDAVP
jgi:hypothetical protein